jgi:uncharacterized protein (DUF2336 family)
MFFAGSSGYSKEQIELFGEVFKILVAAIELKTRETLARRLATDPNIPAALIRAFALDDDIAVAGPILRQSPVLSEADLVASTRSQTQGHLYAIAQRQLLTEAVTDILIQRGESRSSMPWSRMRAPAFPISAFANLSRVPIRIPSSQCTWEREAIFRDITF